MSKIITMNRIVFLALLVLSACGGGGSDAADTPAVVGHDNELIEAACGGPFITARLQTDGVATDRAVYLVDCANGAQVSVTVGVLH